MASDRGSGRGSGRGSDRASDRPSRRPPGRLLVFSAIIVVLIGTLAVRLAYVQLADRGALTQTAHRQHLREVGIPAPRGSIVDAAGRSLAGNRITRVVSVDRSTLSGQADEGKAVLGRLAVLLKVPVRQLSRETTPCARGVPKPCFTGSPYQPVPVLTDASDRIVLAITEHREDYAGVVVTTEAVREYPGKTLASHELGYVGSATQDDVDATEKSGNPITADDTVGRSGLEQYYDAQLRGKDGVNTVAVDNRGTVIGQLGETAPVPGDTVVTSLDARLQAAAENALAHQLAVQRATTDPKTHRKFVAPTGAVVIMDPRTGRILALASNPGYDPNEFVGGISQQQYAALTSAAAGTPLLSRAVQGQFAPGSTFKLSTASTLLTDGQSSTTSKATCPSFLQIGAAKKKNYDSESLPDPITVGRALAFSCDTFFYQYALSGWRSDQQRVADGKAPVEAMQAMARQYGFGSKPGIDLPASEQSAGSIVGRAQKQKSWEANRATYCAAAKKGYPDVKDPAQRTFFTKLARENCSDGWRFNGGDAADFAIGQGDTLASPLQIAAAYSALVNGGTLYSPTLGRAIVDPHGKVVKTIKAADRRTVPVPKADLDYIRASLTFGNGLDASGEAAFAGFPRNKVNIGGKTGTAEVYGKQDTSWFASWARAGAAHESTLDPHDQTPQYVVIGMLEQSGTGASASGKMVRRVYDAIYGLEGHTSVLPGSAPESSLPTIKPYAQVGLPTSIVGPAQPTVTRSADPTTKPEGTAAPAGNTVTRAPASEAGHGSGADPPAGRPIGPVASRAPPHGAG